MSSYFDAFHSERRFPVNAWDEDIVIVEESSDEEEDIAELRRRAKSVSEEAVAQRCLPQSARQSRPSSSPFASMMLMAEAASVLDDLVSKPALADESPHGRVWQRLKASNLLPVSSAHRHTEALKDSKCAEYSFLDNEEDQTSANAAERESSLVRGYDALGADQFSLDDSNEADASCRASSITRGYDALGSSLGVVADIPPHRAGNLKPVRPPSRATSPCPPAGLCAMDLDIGPAHASRRRDSRQVGDGAGRAKVRQSHSLGALKSMSKMASSTTTLPPLASSKAFADAPMRSKAGLTMQTGSAGALSWEVPLRRPPTMGMASRPPVF